MIRMIARIIGWSECTVRRWKRGGREATYWRKLVREAKKEKERRERRGREDEEGSEPVGMVWFHFIPIGPGR